ncbi:alpha/beta fold hydrolase [Hydrocarboniphaga effusa]|uniref:Alpha/beta hydrolase fold protein n=1 Tax=Hydrocarboniphaga effusa AP103 TaxID=1172194 RepID=I7ZFL7_9GAMM|nr:alpha/beta fold hydrolase [Hydrocarboniphaga effusa]EIT70472.1 alpha/beta hydrolase fold protein [Hydrocarboniphaga effusa AP103]
MSTQNNPEIGRIVDVGGISTNVHDVGTGHPVMLLHGSGPGVSAYANWRLVLPSLAQSARVIAPDLVGFGYTPRPEGFVFGLSAWREHAIALLDTLGIRKVDLVGNSFGGALALSMAIHAPERVRKLVLMGSVGVPFELTTGLDEIWGYEPSFGAMRKMLDLFAYDRHLVTDELAELRYRATLRPGVQESYAAMFPAPRQRWVDALASPDDAIRALGNDTLILHGRDDLIIPLDNALRLHHLIQRSQLHVFGQCGHWTQIEHAARFSTLVCDFLAEQVKP